MNQENSKIVYAALSRMSEDRNVIKRALSHWQDKLGHLARVNVVQSVELIESYLGLDTAEKKVLMMSMHAASSKDSSQLKPVPEYILGTSNDDVFGSVSSAPESNGPPHVVLSESFFELIMAGARKRDSGLATELEEILMDEGLQEASESINKALKKVANADLKLAVKTSADDCKDFCHAFYMLVCDVYGPVVADELSYKVVAQLLETPEASRFDPRELI